MYYYYYYCIKDLGVFLDSKLYFHQHVDYLFSDTITLLGLIRSITFSFSSLDSLMILYSSLVRSKLEYASVAWNSLTNTKSNKLERIQKKFATLFCNRFFKNRNAYNRNYVLDNIKLNTLYERRRYFDVLFYSYTVALLSVLRYWKLLVSEFQTKT
jgi:hypothetical protein